MDFSNTGGSRSPFSPRSQSMASRRSLNISLRKAQSKFIPPSKGQNGEIICKTHFNSVESYGLPLPVLVTETLTFDNAQVSVKFSTNGWCWLVCGRKLLVWHYRETKISGKTTTIPTCRELQLPQTDLSHKAGLVNVFFSEGNQLPSCIGVSPEGIIRYWPTVAQESTYVDEAADLQGQECDILTEVMPLGCLLATTTCTMVMVQPTLSSGRQSVHIRTLRPPTGWLGGFGRRVSLLFFGSMPSGQMVENKLIGIKVLDSLTLPNEEGVMETDGPYAVCVSGGPNAQLWRLGDDDDKLLYEIQLTKPLRDACMHAQMQPPGDIGTLDIFVLDMHASANGLLLLIASVNLSRSPDMRYALAQVNLEENAPSRITQFVPLKIAAVYRNEPECEAMALKFLHIADRAYLYTQRELWVVSSTIANEKPDYLELGSDNNKIFAGELCFHVPLLFTKNHGIVAVVPNDYIHGEVSICESPIGSPIPMDMYDGHLSLYEIDPHEVSLLTSDIGSKLKTAFLYHVRRDAVACRAIVQDLFPTPPPNEPVQTTPSRRQQQQVEEEVDVDATLDRTVVQIASELIDDIPAGDPRWHQSNQGVKVTIPLGSSTALHIPSQLRDKQQAFNLFIDFLRATGLWQRLGLISRDGMDGVIETVTALSELWEKLAVAVALRKLQQGPYQNIIDTAIHKVVESEEDDDDASITAALRNGILSASDVFYKKVSLAHRALEAAVPTRVEPKTVFDTNAVILGVLQEIQKCRLTRNWPLNSLNVRVDWAAPWTSSAKGLLNMLVKQHAITVSKAAHMCQDPTLRSQLYDQGVSLAEYALTELKDYAEKSRRGATVELYESTRKEVIQLYLEENQFNRASILAEKFMDFDMLIQICIKSEDMDKLNSFMDKYAKEGMCERTFAWFIENGRSAEMLKPAPQERDSRATAWLASTPSNRALYALHALRRERFEEAAAAFLNVAETETAKIARTNTSASLAKLCLQVVDEPMPETEELKRQVEATLTLCQHHTTLPRSILHAHGLHEEAEARELRVFTPHELIDMYITTDDRHMTEYDYKKALELTDYIEDQDEKSLLRLKIWCASILHDDWSVYNPDSPLEAVQEKVFFRLADLANLMGCDLEEYLPSVEEILSAPEMSDLARDRGFQFILKYGYEYMDKSLSED